MKRRLLPCLILCCLLLALWPQGARAAIATDTITVRVGYLGGPYFEKATFHWKELDDYYDGALSTQELIYSYCSGSRTALCAARGFLQFYGDILGSGTIRLEADSMVGCVQSSVPELSFTVTEPTVEGAELVTLGEPYWAYDDGTAGKTVRAGIDLCPEALGLVLIARCYKNIIPHRKFRDEKRSLIIIPRIFVRLRQVKTRIHVISFFLKQNYRYR